MGDFFLQDSYSGGSSISPTTIEFLCYDEHYCTALFFSEIDDGGILMDDDFVTKQNVFFGKVFDEKKIFFLQNHYSRGTSISWTTNNSSVTSITVPFF